MPAEQGAVADELLRRECRAFTRYLVDAEPDAYIEARYVAAQPAVYAQPEPIEPLDLHLVEFAARGAWHTRIADAYSRLRRPRGLLRRKLILVFAILENSREFHARFTKGGDTHGKWSALVRVAMAVATFSLAAAAGCVLIGPRELFSRRQRAAAP